MSTVFWRKLKVAALALCGMIAVTQAFAVVSQFYDNVQVQVASAPGTGTITLGSAIPGHQSDTSAGIANGVQLSYLITDAGNNWEIGQGTYNSIARTLTRGVLWSSNGNAAVNLSSAAVVSVDFLAEDLANYATDQFVNNNGGGVVIDTLTAGASPSLTDTACVNSTFRICEIDFENVVPTTSGAGLGMQVEVGGTWETSGYLNDDQYFRGEGSAGGSATTSVVQFTPNYSTSATYNPSSTTGITGKCWMVNPAYATTVVNPINCDITFKDAGGDAQRDVITGFYNAAATIQGFKFLENTSSIAQGVIEVKGFM